MWILREIEKRGGGVGFRDFMELALYHPEHGYYATGRPVFGRGGDYLTAPTVSDWYAAVIAGVLDGLAAAAGRLHLVDVAAADGSFLHRLLEALDDRVADCLARVTGVERSPTLRRQSERRLASSPVAVAITDEVPPAITGPAVAHASELYDSLPVHRVERTATGLVELTVELDGDELAWGRRAASEQLVAYFESHEIELAEGQLAEANLEAEAHHRRVLGSLGEGLVLVLDYGYPARRLYDPRGRGAGSLVGYRRHRIVTDPLADPGEQDLTSHVNFDDLRRAAASSGWREVALMSLAEFLVRAGIGELLERRGFGVGAELDADTYAARQEVKQLLDPEGMGSDLKMLVQGRGELAALAEQRLDREI